MRTFLMFGGTVVAQLGLAAGVASAQLDTGAVGGLVEGVQPVPTESPIVFAHLMGVHGDFGPGVVIAPGGGNGRPPCDELVWDNAPDCPLTGDGITAVESGENILNTPDSAAADDVFLTKGFIYTLQTFCGVLVTNDFDDGPDMPDAILRVYSDCNGFPDSLLMTFMDPTVEDLGEAPFGSPGQFRYFQFCFDLNKWERDRSDSDERLWFSLVGVGDQGPGERYFWASGNDGTIQGAQGKRRFNGGPWEDIGPSPNGPCTDLEFYIEGRKCACICDNTPFEKDNNCLNKILNTANSSMSQVADNFQVVSCKATDVCKIEAWIATNCDITRTVMEIYGNDCDCPDEETPMVFTDPWVFEAGNTIISPVSGAELIVYRVCFEFDTPGTLLLQGGQNYWVSIYNPGGTFLTDEAYTLCKDNSEECDIKISQAKFLSPNFEFKEWTPIDQATTDGIERDIAFRVLGTDLQIVEIADAALGSHEPRQPADVNDDGTVNIEDLIRVINSYGTE